jgi:transposase
MNQKKQTAESKVKEIRRHTRKKYSSEEKIRIVIEGLRGESSIAELCRKEGISGNLYYNWSKDFLEAGKRRLAGDIKREATTNCPNKVWFSPSFGFAFAEYKAAKNSFSILFIS